jgi:hypothetical protein
MSPKGSGNTPLYILDSSNCGEIKMMSLSQHAKQVSFPYTLLQGKHSSKKHTNAHLSTSWYEINLIAHHNNRIAMWRFNTNCSLHHHVSVSPG